MSKNKITGWIENILKSNPFIALLFFCSPYSTEPIEIDSDDYVEYLGGPK